MEYITIYNIIDQDISLLNPIIVAIIGLSLIYATLKYGFLTRNNKISKYLSSSIIFITMSLYILFYIKELNMKDMYKNNRYKIAEGVVENYIPEVEKKNAESFSVNGVKFIFYKNEDNGGFHETGKVYNGLKVKIYYIEDMNRKIILRLDRQR